VLPTDAPAWARNRERLWNAAEQSETRKNSTVARDFVVSLPAEFTAAQRKELTMTLAGEISRRHHCAVDVAVHRPSRGGDSRNFHAHLLCSTRRLPPEGFTDKTRELDDTKTGEILYWRERWAALQNERLKQHGHPDRVDHRTLKAQGIERESTQHRGTPIDGILARGKRSHVVERRQR
jgi:ATP-dependent exoDNAse (exonuclease V) alpha subunit